MDYKNQENRVLEIFKRFEELNPNPQTELDYDTPFTLLISVVLSARATDKSVNLATKQLFQVAKQPQDFIKLGREGLLPFIKTIGLYQTKGKHIIELSHIILDRYNGEVPTTREELMTLPGVGQKTANVILNVLYDEPCIPVDTHVFRVAHRLGLSSGKTPIKVETDLLKIIPQNHLLKSHHWLVLHGRYICKALAPKCNTCPLSDLCPYFLSKTQNL